MMRRTSWAVKTGMQYFWPLVLSKTPNLRKISSPPYLLSSSWTSSFTSLLALYWALARCLTMCCCHCCCSVTKLSPTLGNPMDCRTPGFPVSHHLPEFAKFTSIESVMSSNHLILCRPLLLPTIFPSIRIFPMSQLLASKVKVLELQLQHQSFQIVFRVDFF